VVADGRGVQQRRQLLTMGQDTNQSVWSDRAAKYKRDGKLYANVEFDDNSNPVRVHLTQDTVRKGEFKIIDGVAVYEPPETIGFSKPDADAQAYVAALPFVEDVVMEADA